MEPKDFILLMAGGSLFGSIFGFVFKDGGGLPVRTWPFATKEQSVRFSAWAMLIIAVVLGIVRLLM